MVVVAVIAAVDLLMLPLMDEEIETDLRQFSESPLSLGRASGFIMPHICSHIALSLLFRVLLCNIPEELCPFIGHSREVTHCRAEILYHQLPSRLLRS